MKVFVCRKRVPGPELGPVVDVLDAAHHTPTPDVLRVFDVVEDDLTPIEIAELKGEDLVENVLRETETADLKAELDRRGWRAITKDVAEGRTL